MFFEAFNLIFIFNVFLAPKIIKINIQKNWGNQKSSFFFHFAFWDWGWEVTPQKIFFWTIFLFNHEFLFSILNWNQRKSSTTLLWDFSLKILLEMPSFGRDMQGSLPRTFWFQLELTSKVKDEWRSRKV